MAIASAPRTRPDPTGADGATRPSDPDPATPGARAATDAPLLISEGHCKGCGLCVGACPEHVLTLDPVVVNALGYHPVRLTDAAACTSCARCARVCPDAIFTVFAPKKEATR